MNVGESGQDEKADAGPIPGSRWRRLRRLLVVGLTTCLMTYLGACVVVFSLQRRLIYFPAAEYWTTPAECGMDFEDLTLTTADGVEIAAWYVPRPRAKGTVLFCHGNAGNIADRVSSLKSLHRLGYNVLIFDYRGYGRSKGKPSEQGTYQDADTAWEYLIETRGEPAERVVLFGRSLGGAVAIDLASRHPPGALVVESTFTSLVAIGKRHYPLLPVGWLCTYRYESIAKVARLKGAKLFIHGTDDKLVPFADGRRLFDAAAEPKEFMRTSGGHNSGGFEYNEDSMRQLETWLDKSLGHTDTGGDAA